MKIKIEGMSCGHCSARVEKALKEVDGVMDVKVNLEDHVAEIKGNPSIENVKAAIDEAGYDFIGEI